MGHLLRLKVVWNLSFPQPYICIPACQDEETKGMGRRMGSLELEWVLNTVWSKALAGAGAIYKQVFSLPFFFNSGFWFLTNLVTSQFLEISGSRNYGIGKVLCIIFRINFTWKACGGGGSCFSFECRLCFILKAWVTRSGCVVSAGFEAVGLGRVIQST